MNRTSKIICLIGQLGNGGTEKQIFLFLKHLPISHFSPIVIVSSDAYLGSRWEKEIRDGLRIPVCYLHGGRAFKFAHYLYLVFRFRPDIILSWSFYMNTFHIFSLYGKFIGALRGSLDVAGKQLSKAHFASCLKPGTFIVNSDLIKKQLVTSGKNEDKIFVVPNIFENRYSIMPKNEKLRIKSELRKKIGIGKDDIVIAGAGRNTPEKDFPFFIDVLEHVMRKNSNVRALLVGECSKSLSREISRRGIEHLFYFCDERESAHEILPAADIFFLSSKSEGMPNILLEAIDSGCLPLAMDVGGVSDILAGIDALIMKERDAQKTAEYIIDLMNKPDLCDNMKKKASDSLRRFLPETVMPQYLEKIVSASTK